MCAGERSDGDDDEGDRCVNSMRTGVGGVLWMLPPPPPTLLPAAATAAAASVMTGEGPWLRRPWRAGRLCTDTPEGEARSTKADDAGMSAPAGGESLMATTSGMEKTR